MHASFLNEEHLISQFTPCDDFIAFNVKLQLQLSADPAQNLIGAEVEDRTPSQKWPGFNLSIDGKLDRVRQVSKQGILSSSQRSFRGRQVTQMRSRTIDQFNGDVVGDQIRLQNFHVAVNTRTVFTCIAND